MTSDNESRFPQVRLADVASVVRGSSPRPAGDPRFFNGDFLPWITVADLTSSDEPTLTSTLSKLTEEGAERTRIFEPGTVLLTNSGATLGVPKICGIRAGANDGIAGFLNLSAELDSFYLYYCLSSLTEHFRTKVASGVGQPNLNTELIGNVHVSKPPLDVQRAVVRVLTTWDRGIRQLNDLIAAKVRFKQGLMQQLLTGQRRFKDFETRDLRTCELQDFLTITARPIDRPTNAYKALGLRSHGKGTFVRFVEDPEQVQMDTLYQVKKNDLIVNITFAWEGAIAIVSEEDEEALVSHRFPTFVFDHSKALPEYLRQVVITPWFIFKMGLVSPGGAGRNRVLNKKDFLKIEIPLPEIDEQSRIASFLGEADREIALLRKSLDSLKQQKKGLMQKLLTGEVRVKL